MNEPKLFAVYLGGRADRCNIELHDVVFVVGSCIEETYPLLAKKWFGNLNHFHIDSYLHLKNIDGYEIELSKEPLQDRTSKKLYFINLGAYKPHEFKSKRGVLQSLIDNALPAEQFTALVDESMHDQSPRKRLSITAKLSRQMYDAERELMDILRGASVLAPEFKELEQEREQRRYERQGKYVKKLMQDKALVKGLTLQKARDILWSLTGRDMYRMLVIERNWTSDEYEKWLGQILVESLLN